MKPVVDGLRSTYRDKIDFMVYANLDGDRAASDFARRQRVTAVPTSMLVAPDGTELRRWVGAVSNEELGTAFERALSQ